MWNLEYWEKYKYYSKAETKSIEAFDAANVKPEGWYKNAAGEERFIRVIRWPRYSKLASSRIGVIESIPDRYNPSAPPLDILGYEPCATFCLNGDQKVVEVIYHTRDTAPGSQLCTGDEFLKWLGEGYEFTPFVYKPDRREASGRLESYINHSARQAVRDYSKNPDMNKPEAKKGEAKDAK